MPRLIKITHILFVLNFICTLAFSQGLWMDWAHSIGNAANHEAGRSTAIDDDGNVCETLNIENHLMPDQFKINNIYPNPFNPIANIQFTISQISKTRLSIYDLNGKLVNILVDDRLNPGH